MDSDGCTFGFCDIVQIHKDKELELLERWVNQFD